MTPPKVFVFTYDRWDSITTSAMLEEAGVDHVVLCHSEEAKQRFIDGGRVAPWRLVATGEPRGLANNRNVALDMMEPGEWAMFLVDDFKSVTELDSYDDELLDELDITTKNSGEWSRRFQHEVGMDRLVQRGVEAIRYADRLGAHLIGFAGNNNALFRRKRWAFNVLADGRAWMVKKGDLRFDVNAQMIDDLCWTAQNIQRYGIVVVNQWVLPDCKRYTAGAFGSIEERLPQKLAEAKYLVGAYPSFITYKRKPGWPAGSHVVLRRQTPPRI